MNVIALDLATKCGYAFYMDGKLIRYGTVWADKKAEDFGLYPFNYVLLAQHTAHRLYEQVVKPCLIQAKGDAHIVVEETTASQSNYSQKKIEFVHYAILQLLQGMQVWYVRDQTWKSKVGARLNKEERDLNKRIKAYKEKTGEKLAKFDLDGEGLKVVGKRTSQHVYLRALKEQLGIALDLKDEDAGAAILLGLAFTRGVALCNGIQSKKKKK
jgi:hypothetical protein